MRAALQLFLGTLLVAASAAASLPLSTPVTPVDPPSGAAHRRLSSTTKAPITSAPTHHGETKAPTHHGADETNGTTGAPSEHHAAGGHTAAHASGHTPKPYDPTGGILFAAVISVAFGLAFQMIGLQIKSAGLTNLLPYTVCLLFAGIGIGLFSTSSFVNERYEALESDEAKRESIWWWFHTTSAWADSDPHFLLFLFLPALIYASASNINYHVFRIQRIQILTLAGIGVVFATLLTGLPVMAIMGWDFDTAMTFGAMVSATDPVAVVALLGELGAPESLSIVIEGESLFNDGTAYVFFMIFKNRMTAAAMGTEAMTVGEGVLYFCRLAFGGALCGLIIGFAVISILRVTSDEMTEVCLTIIAAYGSFIAAEALEMSGVLSVVFVGLVIARAGKTRFTNHHGIVHFWHTIEFLANTILFVVAGVIMAVRCLDSDIIQDTPYLILIYLLCNVVRFVVTFGLGYTVLIHTGFRTRWQELTVMSYAGLRGAVGLALALIINHEPSIDEPTRKRFLFHMAGIALLTLLINGVTTGPIVKALGFTTQLWACRGSYNSVTGEIYAKLVKLVADMKRHPELKFADWIKVWEHMPVYTRAPPEPTRLGTMACALPFPLHSSQYRDDATWEGIRPFVEQALSAEDAKEVETFMRASLSNELFLKKVDAKFSIAETRDPALKLLWRSVERRDGSGAVSNPNPCAPRQVSREEYVELSGKAKQLTDLPIAYREIFVRDKWAELTEARRRYLSLVRAGYWHSLGEGTVGQDTARVLLGATEKCMDAVLQHPLLPAGLETRMTTEVNEWIYLDSLCCIGRVRKLIYNHLTSPTSRKLYCARFAHILANMTISGQYDTIVDLTNCFIDVHMHVGESFQHEYSSMHPIILDMVASEGLRCILQARSARQECPLETENGRNVLTKHAIRRCLHMQRTLIDEMLHEGKCEPFEADLLGEALMVQENKLMLRPPISMKDPNMQTLKIVSFFTKASLATLDHCNAMAEVLQFSQGELIYAQGDGPSDVLIIADGVVDLYRKNLKWAAQRIINGARANAGGKQKHAPVRLSAGKESAEANGHFDYAPASEATLMAYHADQMTNDLVVAVQKATDVRSISKQVSARMDKVTNEIINRTVGIVADADVQGEIVFEEDAETKLGCIVDTLHMNGCVGALSVLTNHRRYGTARARTKVFAIRMKREHFLELTESDRMLRGRPHESDSADAQISKHLIMEAAVLAAQLYFTKGGLSGHPVSVVWWSRSVPQLFPPTALL